MEFGPDLTTSTRQGRATSVFIYVSKRHMQGKRWAGLSTSHLVGNIPWQWVGMNKEWCPAKCFALFCPINSKCLLRPKDQRLLKIRGLLFWQMENLPWFRGREGFKYFIHNFTQGQYAGCKVVIRFLKHILTLKTSQLSQQLCFSEDILIYFHLAPRQFNVSIQTLKSLFSLIWIKKSSLHYTCH